MQPEIASLGGASVVRVDYGQTSQAAGASEHAFCALLVLPAEQGPASMAAAVRGLSAQPIPELLGSLRRSKIRLSLPRFKAEFGVEDLVAPLREMGLKQSFGGNGQFLRLCDDAGVHIGQVLHKTTIEVTEEGTVAAAATAVVMKSRCRPRPPPEITFDRPFVMLVVHASTGVPLFIGRFNEPQLI